MRTVSNRRVRSAACHAIESLEARCLLSAAVVSQIPTQTLNNGQAPTPISLTTFFNDPTVTGTAVDIKTNVPTASGSDIPIILADSQTPQTVANFLKYISSGEYANTIIHRSALISNTPFVIQGGGFTTTGTAINVFGTVPSEPGISNTTGTIAMALTSAGPNSGTDQWFINLANNNGQTPNFPNLDNTSDGGPFTAFGHVAYNGLAVANAIAALPVINDTFQNGAWDSLPVQNYTGPNPATSAVPPADMVVLNPVVVPGGLTFSATSSNPGVVAASISGASLSLTPVGSGLGSSVITVTATDLGGGTTSSMFTVNVGSNSPQVLIGAGGAKSVNFTDANNTVATVKLKGPGSATVSFNGTSLTQSSGKTGVTISGSNAAISTIDLTGTTGASTLTITTKHGTKVITVGSITTQDLKSIMGPGVNLTGNLTGSGVIGSLTLASATGGTLTASSINSLTLTGDSADSMMLSGTGVSLNKFKAASVSAGTWFTSGSINSVQTTKGDFAATVDAPAVNSLKVKGNLSNAALQLTGSGTDLKTLMVNGAITGSAR